MRLEELYFIKESLEELIPDPEIDFGPAYELTKQRKQLALVMIRREIKNERQKESRQRQQEG